jgi:hypothetical protein
MTHSPIRPGTSVIHLCDVCSLDEIFDSSGQSQGLHLIWKMAEDFDHPDLQVHTVRVGQRAHGQSMKPDTVVSVKSLLHPVSGVDHVVVIRHDGSLIECVWNAGTLQLDVSAPVQLPPADAISEGQASYRIVGFVHDVATESVKLGLVYCAGGRWYFNDSANSGAIDLNLSQVTDVLASSMTQYGLRQSLNFWCRLGQGEADPSIDSAKNFDSAVWACDLASLLAPETQAATVAAAEKNQYTLTSKLLIQVDSDASVGAEAAALDLQSNDEHWVLRYYTSGLNCVEVLKAESVDGQVKWTQAAQTEWGCSNATALTPELTFWRGPDYHFVVVPYSAGDGAGITFFVKLLGVDFEKKTLIESLNLDFPIHVSSTDSHPFWQIGAAVHVHILSATQAELRVTSKLMPAHPGTYTLTTHTYKAVIDKTAAGLSWTKTPLYLSQLPLWFASAEPLSTAGGPPHFGRHRIMPLQVDWRGKSILYGVPKLTQKTKFAQIFGLYQTPPYETSLMGSEPVTALNFSDSSSVSNTVTTHSNTFSNVGDDVSISVWGQSLSVHVSKSWSTSTVNTKSNHFTTDLHLSSTFSREDMLHAATTAYDAWDYPIYQKAVSEKPIGQVSVIVPQIDNAMTLMPVTDKDFAYDQDYEVGMILSYMSAAKPGYTQEGLLFHPVSLPVMGDPSSSTTLSYNSSNTTMTSDSTTQDVSVNAGGSLSLDAHDPAGIFHFQNTASYHKGTSKGSSDMSDVTLTKNFGLTFTLGSVSDPVYQYELTPLVYKNSDTHVISVKFDLNLTGVGWSAHFSKPCPVLFRPFFNTSQALIQAYSRNIRFTVTDQGSTPQLSVLVFNNALVSAEQVMCHVYAGMPKLDEAGGLSVDGLVPLSTQGPFDLTDLERHTLDFSQVAIATGTKITVQLVCSHAKTPVQTYWGCYPYSDLGHVLTDIAPELFTSPT